MTDRQLLEAAASAAGVRYDPAASKPHPKSGAFWGLWLVIDGEPSEYARRYWNPLADDGDAMRLAVKLGLWTASDNDLGQTFVADDPEGGGRVALIEWHSAHADPYAATRRAVVRAAASLPPHPDTATDPETP